MLPRRTLRATSRTAKKPANSLVNPWVSRMNSSAKQISPISRRRDVPRAWPIFPCSGRLSRTSWKPSRACRLRAGICRQRHGIRQGGKLTRGKRTRRFRMRHKSNCASCPARPVARRFSRRRRAGKPSLTVFCCNRALSYNISASGASSRDLDQSGIAALEFRKRRTIGRQIDQAARPAEHLAAAIRPRAVDTAHVGIPAGADRG